MLFRGKFFSSVLNMDTAVTIAGPDDFSQRGERKVAYLLHGLCSTSDSWVDYTRLPVLAMEQDAIIVMPEVGRSFYADMRHGLKYFTYVSEELPRFCKSTFCISQRREDTAVIGGSMGAYGALKLALLKPEQYGICGALTPACLFLGEYLTVLSKAIERGDKVAAGLPVDAPLTEDLKAIFGKELVCGPDDEIAGLVEHFKGDWPTIYMACGKEDSLLFENRRFAELMKGRNSSFQYEELSGGHDWAFFDKGLERMLTWMKEKV